jgi:hypothetical protein
MHRERIRHAQSHEVLLGIALGLGLAALSATWWWTVK